MLYELNSTWYYQTFGNNIFLCFCYSNLLLTWTKELNPMCMILFSVQIREASKKTGSSTKNKGNARKKFRGILVQDGKFVQKGAILVLQNSLQFFPGLNVNIYL